ncbi:hypothetical protein DP113_17075 [Brasilonema octagenarum UFV-E1]|uniref:Uncharacterized protein n=1 Tax=Brasilonema sennae CENA114 TaxID=415709 RepID=A0A856MGT6_9CYAN|nr:hypothetical protein DP114_17140 [Brasilonema sennae CENA114]QDL15755.1 hypothetical protein DP113_17075 [Brasilonema octagenarum UFV-E1]
MLSPKGRRQRRTSRETRTPFGFASRLRRETLLQRWSHQIPRSGDPHQVLALQRTGSPTICGLFI